MHIEIAVLLGMGRRREPRAGKRDRDRQKCGGRSDDLQIARRA
jgi:hypothetical protein